jgi:hypothetical protein
LLAKDLSYCSSERQQELEMLVNRIGAMLAGLERSLKAKVLTAGVKTEVAEEDADK